jgi:hypothetical protein
MKALTVFILVFSMFPLSHASDKVAKTDRIKELKDKVLDRKLQLNLVRELIKRENLDTQYPVLSFHFNNKMSSRYLLVSLEYFVDESKVYSVYNDLNKLGNAEKVNDKKIENYNLNLSPGKHSVRVVAVYNGNDTGVFSYLSDYKVRSEGSVEIEVKRGEDIKLDVVGFEKGGLFTDFKERPGIKISVR